MITPDTSSPDQTTTMDCSNDPRFIAYYAAQSQQTHTIALIRHLKTVLKVFFQKHSPLDSTAKLNILDIGCGAGTQAFIWAEDGHNVHGLDISEQLIAIGRQRMTDLEISVDFQTGTATQLPWPSQRMDICLLPELLEHVPDWLDTLKECARVLKPGGMLYIATSNRQCPIQNEFTLPLYSWYPSRIKRWCEQKALSSHRHWVNYATYPAINWFTHTGLAKTLSELGFSCHDRFDLMDLSDKPRWQAWLVNHLIRRYGPIRYLAYFFSVSTMIVAIKQ